MNDPVGITRIGQDLVVRLPSDLPDDELLALQDELLAETSRRSTRGVLVELSALDLVDAYVGRALARLSAILGLVGTRVVLVGMRAEVALTLVELGVALERVDTAIDLELGQARLEDAPSFERVG